MNTEIIDTERLRLIACSPDLTRAAFQDLFQFSTLLGANVPQEWPPVLLFDVQEWIADTVSKDPKNASWWLWYIVLKGDSKTPDVLIGNSGFKGLNLPRFSGHEMVV